MQNLWYIYKQDGTVLGPLSPFEIRQALRRGEIDPYDKVQRVNSKLRIELVEVDEIFKDEVSDEISNEKEDLTATIKYKQDEITDLGNTLNKDSVYNLGKEKDQQKLKEYLNQKFQQQILYDTESNIEEKVSKLHKQYKEPKRFNLIDTKNRVIGPLSAKEIVRLFFKGIVTNSTVVCKIGQKKTIPIAKFVALYVTQKNNNQKYVSAVTRLSINNIKKQPATKVSLQALLAFKDQIQQNINKILWVFGLLFLLLICLITLYILFTKDNSILFQHSSSASNNTKKSNAIETKQITSDLNYNSTNNIVIPSKNTNTNSAVQNMSNNINENLTINQTANLQSSHLPNKPVISSNSKTTATNKNNKGIVKRNNKKKNYSSKKKKSYYRNSFTNTQKIKKYQSRKPTLSYYSRGSSPTPTSSVYLSNTRYNSLTNNYNRQYGNTTVSLDSKIGQEVRIDKVSFSLEELERCNFKCTMFFKNPNGIIIKGVFFKEAFLPVLKRYRYVNIVGTLQKRNNTYIMYIHNISK